MSAGDWIEKEVEERRQMIGGIDNMWLLLSDATDEEFNPVCALSSHDGVELTNLHRSARKLQKKFPKYHQRLTSVGRKLHGARFEDDPDFDINNHVHSVRLPEPAGKRELDDLMGKFIAQDWDLRRPLWEMILVENYRDDDGAECAIISRGHHTLADGQGFVISQLYITSYHDELVKLMNSTSSKLHAMKNGRIQPSKVNSLLRPLDRFADDDNVMIAPLIQLCLASLFWITYAVSFGISLFISVYQGFIQVVLFLLTCWRVEMLTAPQHGPRVHDREFSSSRTVTLDDIRLCQKAFSGPYPGSEVKGSKTGQVSAKSKIGHVTLNDLICSVMVDVLAEELATREKEISPWGITKEFLKKILPSPIGFFIPISVRKPGDWSMRNLSTGSMVYLDPTPLDAPVNPKTLHKHIHECRSALSLLKHSLIPRLLFHLTQLSGQAPALWPIPFGLVKHSRNFIRKWVLVPLIHFALQSCTFGLSLISNVPGPAKNRITLEGVEVIRWTALPPQGGKGTLGMGIISYAGSLCISVAADKVPASEGVARRICERFEKRFQMYLQCAKEVLEHAD
ncbi:hypothetical protein K474DRAFT_1592391 [Panus rudis PR-1116 ss-1]|nr:hypothetical protein K474DRAFT_1592391 [Panus rudis PR-1116 ss-1]